MTLLQMLYWVVSSIKRWYWSYGPVHLYKYVSSDFDNVCCWWMCWLLFKNAVASSEVILAEVFVVVEFLLMSSVGVVCRLLLSTGCQRAACSVIGKNCMLVSWIAFVLIAFDCVQFICSESTFVLADWRMPNNWTISENVVVAGLLIESWETDAPRVPTYINQPLPCTYCLRLPVFPKFEFAGIPIFL